MTPKAFEEILNFKPNLLDSEFTIKNIEYHKEGKIHPVRFIRSDKILNIFGEKFHVISVCQYEYVKATIHLKEELLKVFLFEGLVYGFKYTLPKELIVHDVMLFDS